MGAFSRFGRIEHCRCFLMSAAETDATAVAATAAAAAAAAAAQKDVTGAAVATTESAESVSRFLGA